ncbi:SDR family NAD(P)-dependent oxidoreductase [Kordiimonas sp. SCSIO 12610]|uniref:SDR family NAD(P)-dependent oxidoreductase n=1 Tax=Kordiimonas sp. SCSIO 12610 TaxID=2829597 RepID=UPI002108BB6F|nr:SDR family NAD(P)-dependent oxidoreductase [Kordiimonas sp. SCSIO 12610]UTW56505.1 SDR family NAD(P)-dependent oxidoreductase [Kordiimonas sp. SCSIO 12610]
MNGTVVILGAGVSQGIGGALARKFAAEGHHVVVTGRTLEKVESVADEIKTAGHSAEAMQVDVTQEKDQDALFEHVAKLGPLSAVLFNAGNNAVIPFAELTSETYEQFWRIGSYGAFLTAKRAIPLLEEQGEGSLFFTGASASLRGRPNFAHFAAMKAGLRMLAQALARDYGPKGVHVVHAIIDGVVNSERTRSRYGEYMDSLGENGVLSPDAVADSYWHIHNQPKSAWTHEIEMRPFSEKW